MSRNDFSEVTKDHWPKLNDMLVGDKIGEGCTRAVYEWKPDSSLVLKVELSDSFAHANVIEYQIWTAFQYDSSMSKYFAPVTWISSCGHYLLMKKCKRFDYFRELRRPNKFPAWLGDPCNFNFGWLYDPKSEDHSFVCIDYGGQNLGDIIYSCGKGGMKLKSIPFGEYGEDYSD